MIARSFFTPPRMIAAVVFALLLITAVVTYLRFQAFAHMSFSFPPPGVIVSVAKPYPFADTIEAVGTAQSNESAALTAKVTETIKSIAFAEGQSVEAGTVLVQLSDAQERASLTEAGRAYKRATDLVKSNAVSLARKDEEKARMDIAQAQVNDRTIVAPFAGIVGLRRVSVGDLVSPGAVITTIDDIDPIKLEFTVPETFLSAVKPEMKIRARTEAFPGEIFEGAVLAIDPRIDPMTRAFSVKALISNTDLRLRPGLLMSVDIIRNERQSLAVPEQAVVYKGATTSVMIVDKDGNAQAQPVTLGVQNAGVIEITKGLKDGENIIVEGLIKTQPGAKVNIVETKSIDDFIASAIKFSLPEKEKALEALSIEKPSAPETSAPPADEKK